MDTLYAASVNHFFSREDSSPTTYCFYSHSTKRMRILILYVTLQLISVVATNAALSPQELYWKSMLPTTTPMPKSIADLLHKPEFNISLRCGHGCFGNQYNHGEFEMKLQDNPNSTDLFFLENDLKFGHKISFIFTHSSNQAALLPRQVVKSIPFSSTKMVEIMDKFGVNPGSIKAEVMKNTIQVCEEPEIQGEDKYCATSLESMLDFVTSKLGKNVEAFSTEMKKKKKETKTQEYRIKNGVKKVGETNLVVCHKLNYVYAVFYCHKMEKTVAYTVSLEGADGSKVKAVSVCHRDTSAWHPKHLAFQMLKVKPGSVPICHFLLPETVVWLPKQY